MLKIFGEVLQILSGTPVAQRRGTQTAVKAAYVWRRPEGTPRLG